MSRLRIPERPGDNRCGESIFIPVVIFLVAFYFVPISSLDGLTLVPGDVGDARLNNYFLENIYQFLVGGSDSLWHLPFFSPFPFVGGFSDNLFGSSLAYIVPRALIGQPDTAFQIWFLLGYFFNFISAFWALRRLGGSRLASSVGALIYTFALPTTAHVAHAQLHYRFGLPIAIVFFADFLAYKNWRFLLIAGAWLVWQFYAGVYMGFFTLLLFGSMSLAYLGYGLVTDKGAFKKELSDLFSSWTNLSGNRKICFFLFFLSLLMLMALLFYPYLQVSNIYGAKRSWVDIASMLPRPQSYFLSDSSFLWSSSKSVVFSGLPMRHEHQMFIGAVPMILALVGLVVGTLAESRMTFTLMVGMLSIAMLLTLNIAGFSLWYLFHWLPLASAIRAMTRIDQALLFPISFLAVVAIDYMAACKSRAIKPLLFIILLLLLTEAVMTSMYSSTKESWRERFVIVDDAVPDNLPDDAILFFAQRSGPWFADEIDAMWVSMRHRRGTINGYSGLFPPGYEIAFGQNCSQLPQRVLAYLEFSGQSGDISAYRELMSRIVPIGFKDCDPMWSQTPPKISG